MTEDNERASRFLEACKLIAEEDLIALAHHKNADLFAQICYYAPSALEALAELDVLIQQKIAADAANPSALQLKSPGGAHTTPSAKGLPSSR